MGFARLRPCKLCGYTVKETHWKRLATTVHHQCLFQHKMTMLSFHNKYVEANNHNVKKNGNFILFFKIYNWQYFVLKRLKL